MAWLEWFFNTRLVYLVYSLVLLTSLLSVKVFFETIYLIKNNGKFDK